MQKALDDPHIDIVDIGAVCEANQADEQGIRGIPKQGGELNGDSTANTIRIIKNPKNPAGT